MDIFLGWLDHVFNGAANTLYQNIQSSNGKPCEIVTNGVIIKKPKV